MNEGMNDDFLDVKTLWLDAEMMLYTNKKQREAGVIFCKRDEFTPCQNCKKCKKED